MPAQFLNWYEYPTSKPPESVAVCVEKPVLESLVINAVPWAVICECCSTWAIAAVAKRTTLAAANIDLFISISSVLPAATDGPIVKLFKFDRNRRERVSRTRNRSRNREEVRERTTPVHGS